MLLETMFANLI